MTPESQCILIAEVCGYSLEECLDGLIEWHNPDGGYLGRYSAGECPSVVPKYTTDLSAMHEAEISVFSDSGMQCDYSRSLIRVIKERSHLGKSFFSDFDLAHATAAQRAEAFLRTLNLWQDDA